MKAFFQATIVFLLMSVLAFAAFVHFGRNFYIKAVFDEVLEEQSGVPVEIQKAVVDYDKGHVTLHNLVFANPEGFVGDHLIKISRIDMDVRMEALWEGKLHATKMVLDAREIYVTKKADGDFNWFNIKSFSDTGVSKKRDTFLARIKKFTPFKVADTHVDHYELTLGQSVFTDYSPNVPLKRNFTLKVESKVFEEVESFKEIVRILAWETLIKMDRDEFQEAFDQMETRIESKIGSRREYLKQWRNVVLLGFKLSKKS